MAEVAPIDKLRLVTPYPHALATGTELRLKEITAGKPCVLHLFTGWGGCWPCASKMDVWAQQYFGQASFVCVGCAGPDLASTFAKQLRLSKCLTTYVDEANGPQWGQLGCNGFIVLDAQGKVACRQTSAFLEVQDLAFAHVESILDAMLSHGPLPTLSPGQHVELHGLSRAELNGTRGYVIEAADATTGRCAVQTYFGKRLSVRPDNLQVVAEDGEDCDEDCGDDGEGGDGCFDDSGSWQTASSRPKGGCDAKGGCGDAKGGCGDAKRSKKSAADCDVASGGEAAMPERMKRALGKAAAEAAPPPSSSSSSSSSPGGGAVGGVEPLAPIESVHIPDLDAEHEACAAALSRLAQAPTREAIEAVIEAYDAHFAHEERLLDVHLYGEAATGGGGTGGGGGGFSAAASMRRSHFADHKRMLIDLRVRAAALPSGGPASGPKAWVHVPSGEVPEAFVDKVLRSFEEHANRYDAAYAAPLAAKLREAQAVPAQ